MSIDLFAEDQDPAAAPHPTGTPPGMDPAQFDAVDETTISPEEQEQYDQFATKALTVIHSKKTQKALLEQLNQKDLELYQSVGNAAAKMAMVIAEQAKAAGVKLSPDVVWHATADYIVPELFEIGEAAGIFPKAPQEQIDMAFVEANRVYGETMLGGPDGDRFSQEAQDFYAQQVAQEIDSGAVSPDDFREGVLGIQRGDPLSSAISSEIGRMGRGGGNGA